MAVNKTIQMVNVSEAPVRIEIGGSPGDGVTEYVIQPGEAQAFHENLCKPIPGAGRNKLEPILARKSMRNFPDGVRRPTLVPASEAKRVKAQYQKELDAWRKDGSPAPKPSAIENPIR